MLEEEEEEEEELSEATAITPVLDDGGGDGGDGGGGVGHAELRLVPEVEYDVPTEPTLTRGPHSPALLYTQLDHPHSHHLSATHGHEHLK